METNNRRDFELCWTRLNKDRTAEIEPIHIPKAYAELMRVTADDLWDAKWLCSFEVEVEDASEYMGYLNIDSIVVTLKDGREFQIPLELTNHESLGEKLAERFDWSDYFADYEASRADRAYDDWKERMYEEGE